MRRKGRKQIAIIITLMFLFSFFPGYGLAAEPLDPSQSITQTLNTPEDQPGQENPEGTPGENPQDNSGENPDGTPGDQPEGNPGDNPPQEPGNDPEGTLEGTSEGNLEQVATEIPLAYVLTVKHVLQTHDGQTIEKVEEIPDVQLGSVVSGIDYSLQDLPEDINFTGSMPESLTIQAENNQIILNYQELPWPEDELLQEEQVPFEQLNEEDMEPYFSDIRLDFSPLNAGLTKNNRSLMRSALNTTLAPGEVKATKTAEWHDYENRIAKITLNVFGEPVPIGADVVLVVDNSGSMANDSGKVRDCTGTLLELNLVNDVTETNIWNTRQTQRQTYTGICAECGKTVEYTIERTRTRATAFNDWGTWSAWSTPPAHSIYRIDIAKQAAASFVSTVLGAGNPTGNRVALVPFSSSGYDNHLNGTGFQNSVSDLTASINGMFAQGGTNYTEALAEAKSYLDERSDQTRPAYVVFVSDGAPGLNGNSPDDPNWNGINQADALKSAGVTIYSVGIALSQENATALTALATFENGSPLYKNVQNVEDLTAVLTKIGGAILNAGTAALMTDEINTVHFDLLSGTSGYDLPDGVTIDTSGDIVKVKWNIGAITKAPQEIVLYVKLKDEYISTGDNYYTNTDINLSYTDTDDQPQTKNRDEIGHPNVVVNHTVTFVAGPNGTLDGTASYSNIPDGTLWEDAVTVPEPVPNPGYLFDGWDLEFPATVTQSSTYTANFTEDEDVTINYEAQTGGSVSLASEEVAPATGVAQGSTATANPGYHFVNWTDEGGNVVGTEAKFTPDKVEGLNVAATYTANFDRNNYTLTYAITGSYFPNAAYETAIYEYGEAVTAIAGPSQTGYTFNGWTGVPETMPASDVTATGYYTARTDIAYTVNYLEQGTDKVLATAKNGTGTFGTEVTETAIEIAGYNQVAPTSATITLAVEGNVIDFYYTPSNNTAYKVEHYQQDLGEATYTLAGTDNLTGTTGELTAAEANSYEGFTVKAFSQETIAADGSTEVEIYYDRNIYEIVYVAGAHGQLIGGNRTDYVEYGDTYPAAPATDPDNNYKFSGWTPALPGANDTVTGNARFTAAFVYNGGGGGGGGGDEPEPIVVPEEPVAIPLNKDDHFAYVVGYPDNTVQPEGNVTREEVAAVFYRLLDANYRETIKTTSNDFPDVGLDRWSSKHIGTLASVDIIVGYPDGTFRPGNSITRAELATIASKFDKLSPFTDNSFSDITGHWANQYINSAAKKGWVNGYPDGTFKPDQAITRAEFMTLVNNVLERRVQKENILPDAKKFPDLSSNEWYYEEVQEAINSHYYQRATRQDYEEWTEIYYPELDM